MSDKVTITGEFQVSDGHHMMDELYEHRHALWITVCRLHGAWRALRHSDGTCFDGWFVLGISYSQGTQITYHLPLRFWDDTEFAATLDNAPLYDGHTPGDVIERLKTLRSNPAAPGGGK